MHIKERLYRKCEAFIDKRLLTVQNAINEIQKALQSETKSSAGDKHETGRAMLQLEREKAGLQLAEIQKTKEFLFRIDAKKTSDIVCLGSIVYTSQVNYYLAISAGEIEDDHKKYYAISPSTPIGKILLSKHVGDQIEFRGQKNDIVKII